ncbi:MAG: hypothetical protein N4A35_02200 [Flavobacteriales bacterium]|jgi:hypothetical protein|nr:hypothetical protein [Flavobacteriales bacterium]
MKQLFITTLFFLCIGASAQDIVNEQQTLFGSHKKSVRGYIALNHKAITLNNQIGLLTGGELSLVFNHKLNVGVFGYGMYNDVQSNYIDHYNHSYFFEYGAGGLKLEPVFFSNAVIHFTLPIEAGIGGAALNRSRFYHEDFEWNVDHNYDIFGFVEPGIKAEVNLFKNLRFAGGIGYQFTDVINLANTENYPLNGWTINAALKLGWF